MTRNLDGTDAVDRFHIDRDLLTDEPVWSVIDENGETLLYQEAPEESADPGGAVVQHVPDGDDRLLEIGFRETRTGYDEFTGQVESWAGYPLRDPVLGDEGEFYEDLPDADSSRFTAAFLVN